MDHVLAAIDDKGMVVDVKELVDKPHHGMGLIGLGPVTLLKLLLKEDYELVLHPQLGIVKE